MWERSFYDAVIPLLGAVRDQPTTHADVANYYEPEFSDMAWELSQKLRGWRAVTLLYGFEERLLGTAEMQGTETSCQPLPDAAMYPFVWGMNVFKESQMVVDYLWYAQTEKGFLQGVELPPQRANSAYTCRAIAQKIPGSLDRPARRWFRCGLRTSANASVQRNVPAPSHQSNRPATT